MAHINQRRVMVKCKKCGRSAPADEFKLDYEYKMVVCPSCYNRKSPQTQDSRQQGFVPINQVSSDREVIDKIKEKNPQLENLNIKKKEKAGWDKDDEFLELNMIKKQEDKKKFEPKTRFVDEKKGKVKMRCPECNFSYAYDHDKKTPRNCPFCGRSSDA